MTTDTAITCDHHGTRRELSAFHERLAAKWRDTNITYFCADERLWPVADAAFKAWADVCGITVARSNNPKACDIHIDFGGPGDNFDGPSGVLAWCYLPNGDDRQLKCRLDPSERWSLSGNDGIYMLAVLTHELGHGLGLDHSDNPADLMWPNLQRGISTPQPGDIRRTQALYGPPVGNPVPPSVPSPLPPGTPTMPQGTLDIVLNIPFIGKATGTATPRLNIEAPQAFMMAPENISIGGIIGLLPKIRTLVPAVTDVVAKVQLMIAQAKAGDYAAAFATLQIVVPAIIALWPQIKDVIDSLK